MSGVRGQLFLAVLLSGTALLGCGRRLAVARGRALFEQQCAACHRTDHVPTPRGPGLGGLFQRPALVNGKDLNEENLGEVIRHGVGSMPPQKLTPQQWDDLLAYLKTL